MSAFRRVLGAFQILGRRTKEVGHPGLAVWVDTGERAARSVSDELTSLAHKNECEERAVVAELSQVAQEGRLTSAELKRLRKIVLPRLEQCAEREHDIGDVVRL